MKAIKSSGTKIEERLAKALWRKGFRYRKNDKTVFGKPDLTFKGTKVAVFVDSEFFHGKDWETQKYRIKTNRDFWWKKIESNIERDKKVNRELQEAGWTVIRFWGAEVKKRLQFCVDEIAHVIAQKNMPKYSDLKRRYNIEIKGKENDHLAGLTHYMHNLNNGKSPDFKEYFADYAKIMEEQEPSLASEPQMKLFGPVHWDVPFPPPKRPKFKFIDLFAGIGGFRMAFQNLGGKCVFSSEWDHFCKITYERNFGEVPFGDITRIDEQTIPDHDVLVAGFPCQPFSIAGVSKKNSLKMEHGFKDKTQGTLFFDIVRILEHKKPRAFFLENVKNLTSHDKGKTFKVISNALVELGYNIHFRVMDGRHYVPQHRERIVIIGFRKDEFQGKEQFSFPEPPKKQQRIRDILEENPDPKYTLSDKLWNYLQEYAKKHKAQGNGFGFGLVDFENVTRTLSARYYKDGSEILIPQENINPRRLTPRECARLQGYPDNFEISVSDNQAYRQFGNSIVVPLMQAVGKNLVKTITTNEPVKA